MKYYTILLLCILFIVGGCSLGESAPSGEAAGQDQAEATNVQEEAGASESNEAESSEETDDAEASAEEVEAESEDAAESTDESADDADAAEEGTEAEDETAASASALNSPLTSPLPTPPAVEIETSSISGAISGQIIAKTVEGAYVPLAGYTIGLGTLVPREDGEGDMAAAYDPSNSPTTTTNEFGQFVFNDIEPGRYGLILDAVVNQALLSYPLGSEEGNGSILMELEADQHVDLGTLRYDSLPLYGFTN